MANILSPLKQLINLMKYYKLDYYLIPTTDEFLSEYPASYARRLEFISHFDGSFGILLVSPIQSYLFTDGRYITQAKQQLDSNIKIINISQISIGEFFKNIPASVNIGYNNKVFSKNFIDNLQSIDFNFVATPDLADQIWGDNQPFKPYSKPFNYQLKYAGINIAQKLSLYLTHLDKYKAEYYLLTDPEIICWLLNIRAQDLDNTPVLLSNLLITKQKIYLFVYNPQIMLDLVFDSNLNVEILNINDIEQYLTTILAHKLILFDANNSPVFYSNLLNKISCQIINLTDPGILAKSCKNHIELEAMQQAHIIDAIAFINTWYEIEKIINNQQQIDELKIGEMLLAERSKFAEFLCESFPSIVGFNDNGAIIHYRANSFTNKFIDKNGILLIDSGGQYLNGTTDVTRTLAIGAATEDQITHYTAVLKGHIDLSLAKFPMGTTGGQLDSFARKYIWDLQLDYDHGTGHGVGCCLNVHEGPQRIGKAASTQKLLPGMVISNEPGIYLVGQYGIRIENLMFVKALNNNFLEFYLLTLIPYDHNLINFSQLNEAQINWLTEYYNMIRKLILPKIENKILANWLMKKLVLKI